MEALSKRIESLEMKVVSSDKKIAQLEAEARKLESEMDDITSVYPEKFYITTAIHYTNGSPHVGHAYENITSDVMARYHRIFGRKVFFLTGTDEHGQKIATTAEKLGIQPIELCDQYAQVFKQLTKDLNMSNDAFVRTTDAQHKKFAQWAFQKALDAGDIYKGTYEGWYNVREETFVSDKDAELSEFKDPESGVPLKKMQEETYFFRMSRYQRQLLDHYETHPEFLLPDTHRQLILNRLQEPLRDISVSRNTFSHGIPLPNDPSHVMYVWFDALSNYCSAIHCPSGENSDFWPANVHIIGKDITWFHSVIWPCMLMSIGLELPVTIFGHGHVSDSEGKKMSKSVGNVIDPLEVIKRFSLDTFRYYICRDAPYGNDMAFSVDSLILLHNSELADALGNLVHRGTNMCTKYCEGKIPAVPSTEKTPFSLSKLRKDTELAMKSFAIHEACALAIESIKETNKYLTENAPWHMKDGEARQRVIRTTLEAIYIAAHFLAPFIPGTSDKIFDKFNTKPQEIYRLSKAFDNLTPGTSISIGNVLFEKYMTNEERAAKEAKSAAPAPKPKKEKPQVSLFASMDIRVGKITKVWNHPESDKLFCEEIDVGEEEPKQIASGLRKFYSLEQMQDRLVIVILNLKAAKLAGFKSFGMVLCASRDDAVEFVEPPSNAKIGERVFIATESGEPLSASQMKKQKVWEKAAPLLSTNDDRIATFNNEPVQTSAGPCTAATLSKASIS